MIYDKEAFFTRLYEKKFRVLFEEIKGELEKNIQSSLIRLCDQTENMLFVTFTPYLVKVCLRTIKKSNKL
jgi:hypothetical protein